jgi:hypothetical protein
VERNKIVTYSLLAHINNSGLLLSDLLAIFEPLVKRILSSMNSDGITSGKNISEIQTRFDDAYKLQLPLPVLRNILKRIAHDVNKEGTVHLQLYGTDDSFIIHNFFFLDFEEVIREKEREIDELESAFKEFCTINSLHEENYSTIFDFIECNKLSLAQYLSVPDKFQNPNIDFNNEAKFVDFFKGFPSLFKKIRDIYLGSIISSYLEFQTVKANSDLEIIFDTNYILSLLDLNSEEAFKTCKTLLDILKAQGVKLRVMDLTITECQHLLERKAEYFDKVFLQKNINSEDIYNACERRHLSKTDLELISSNLEQILNKLGISVIPNTTKYQNLAKYSPEFESLKRVRNIDFAALHDATAIHYVRDKRGKQIKDFDKVNCWFVNNSSNLNFFKSLKTNGFQPEAIKAEDLLNILWLSNPNILTALKSKDLIDIGITRLISCTLNDSFPRASVLRDFEENIQKYAPMELTDKDILRIASRVANKALSNIDELNALAESNQRAFVDRLKKEAAIEKAREETTNQKLREFIDKLNQKQLALEKLTTQADERIKTLDQRSEEFRKNEENIKQRENESNQKVESITSKYESEKKQRISLTNQRIGEERKKYIRNMVFKWRLKTFGYLLLGLVVFVSALVYAYYLGDWKNEQAQQVFEQYKANLITTGLLWLASAIFTGFLIKRFSDQFSASNLNAFKLGVERELPANLRDVSE